MLTRSRIISDGRLAVPLRAKPPSAKSGNRSTYGETSEKTSNPHQEQSNKTFVHKRSFHLSNQSPTGILREVRKGLNLRAVVTALFGYIENGQDRNLPQGFVLARLASGVCALPRAACILH